MKKKYYYVYKIINKINQHEYIGFHSTNNLDDGYMGSGKVLQYAYEKYGIKNFKKYILKMFDNKKEAEEYESKLVNEEYVNRSDTYNISIGGNVCILYGENNGFYGKTHSKETIQKIKNSIKNFYANNDGHWKDKNMYLNDDVIINKVRYFSFGNAVKKLKLPIGQVKKLLLQPGNGYVNKDRQLKLIKENEQLEIRKKIHRQNVLKANQCPIRNKKISDSLKGRSHPWQDKINKNPKKIAKTAIKHRGMKRSKITCKNISKAKKEYYKHNETFNKGLICIHNPKTNERKYISKNDVIPHDWKLGLGSTKAKNKKWYMNPNDLTQTKNFSKNEKIPDGWIPGNGNLRLARIKKKENNGSINNRWLEKILGSKNN